MLLCSYSYGQMEQYSYRSELKGVSDQWHTLTLPNEIFGKVSQDLSDIRIFGITDNNDTVEAPYSIRQTTEKISFEEVPFNIVNTSYNEKGYYYTFEVPTQEAINQMKLEFENQNFDWRLKLEGSQNQQEWFTITDNYRVVSIKTQMTDFQFTDLNFDNSKYRFFRLLIRSREEPSLLSATVAKLTVKDGLYRDYRVKSIKSEESRESNQTQIEVELEMPVPIVSVDIDIADNFDYYRPIVIEALTDSFNTEKGWKYRYRDLTSATLNSIENNQFKFSSRTTQKLRVTISNENNQTLTLNSIRVKGYVNELVARFTKPATYFLTYGNSSANKPHYDIEQFLDRVPKDITPLEIGSVQKIEKIATPVVEPLFQNSRWLWVVMTVVILLLGWFSLKMIRKD